MMMSGLPHPEVKRETILLSSLDTGRAKSRHLLSVKFETNPLDSDFNQTLDVSAQPLEIVYDAVSVMCPPGLYAGPNYCQSHMFLWTRGC